MPLSEKGRRMLRRFKKKYGKEKGMSVFNSWKKKNCRGNNYV